jgi:hypothetical protein
MKSPVQAAATSMPDFSIAELATRRIASPPAAASTTACRSRCRLNITRVSRPIPEKVPREEEIFGAFFARHGAEQSAGELSEHRA